MAISTSRKAAAASPTTPLTSVVHHKPGGSLYGSHQETDTKTTTSQDACYSVVDGVSNNGPSRVVKTVTTITDMASIYASPRQVI